MPTLLDCILLSALILAPFMPVLYALMVVVADSMITAAKNWNE